MYKNCCLDSKPEMNVRNHSQKVAIFDYVFQYEA
jgi:hypothetical protein